MPLVDMVDFVVDTRKVERVSALSYRWMNDDSYTIYFENSTLVVKDSVFSREEFIKIWSNKRPVKHRSS